MTTKRGSSDLALDKITRITPITSGNCVRFNCRVRARNGGDP
jgi:hypothetical protein